MTLTLWSLRGLGLVLLPVGLVTFLACVQPDAPPSFADTPPATCTSGLKVEYKREPNGLVLEGEGTRFNGVSLMSLSACQGGELIVDVEPEVAGEELPRLTVGFNNRFLGEWEVSRRQTLKVPLPGPGKVTLGYFNDYYRSESRSVTYEKFKLSDGPCSDLELLVSPATGGAYNRATGSATVTAKAPLIIKPCSGGILRFLVVGRKAAGIYPTVQIKQGQSLKEIIHTSSTRHVIQMRVKAAPVTLTLLNPYFRELADRNLIVHSVKVRSQPSRE